MPDCLAVLRGCRVGDIDDHSRQALETTQWLFVEGRYKERDLVRLKTATTSLKGFPRVFMCPVTDVKEGGMYAVVP